MPNLNLDPSDQINISGDTFTLGAVLDGTPTTGQVVYNIEGLTSGDVYYFAVVSFNNLSGYSGWAGPIVVYILPEIRQEINAFSWSWPNDWIWSGNFWTKSDNNKNLVAFSQDFNVTQSIPGYDSPCWAYQNITNVTSGITAPDGSTTASLIRCEAVSGVYSALRQIQYDLKPGTTYTFSFYGNISKGTTGGSFRFRNVTGLNAIDNIEPSITYTTDQWERYAYTLQTSEYQTGLDFYVISRNLIGGETLTGITLCIWGAQLEEGSTATEYSRSYGYREPRGGVYGATMAIYEYDSNLWANYGPNNGITYVWPLVNLYRYSFGTIDQLQGWTLQSELNIRANQLKLLPEGKRAIQPTLFNREDWFSFVSDTLSATGAPTRTYFNDTYPFGTNSLENRYPGVWNDFGLSGGQQFFNQVLDIFGSTGATFDYLFGDNESNFAQNFSVAPIPNGITAFTSDSRYYNEWRGLSSWNALMNVYGVCAQNILGPASYQSNDKVAYVVWNNIAGIYAKHVMSEIFANPTLQRYPNAIVSNYAAIITDNGPTYAPPDAFGHPTFSTTLVGNAASPLLYGEITQIDPTVSPNNVFVNLSDPSFLILSVPGASGPTLPKGPWTSFIQAMQTLRSAKRGAPNIPITPWITSVKDSGIAVYNDDRVGPTIGLADVTAGYNYTLGYTIGGNGNSAYYYELLRHTCLHGVKAIGYFNSSSFLYRDENGVLLDDREYTARGLTTYFNDLYLFNETLKEINQKIKGFTLTTADSSRISWIAPYLASGAPGPNGTTWYWRITTNPGNTTFVNGQTLSVSNNNIVGTWVETSGPTLSGINIVVP